MISFLRIQALCVDIKTEVRYLVTVILCLLIGFLNKINMNNKCVSEIYWNKDSHSVCKMGIVKEMPI